MKNFSTIRQLTKFELVSASPTTSLYTNGHQQVLLRIRAVVTEDGNPVSLSASERASLRIVLDSYTFQAGQDDDKSGYVVPRKDGVFGSLEPFGSWNSTEKDNGYDPFPSSSSPSTADKKDDRMQDIYLYVSCSAAGAIRNVPFCALIRMDDGTRYCTNKKKWDNTGKESSTAFDYTVNLLPQTPPRLTNDYIRAEPDGEPADDGFYNIRYPLEIYYPGRPEMIKQKALVMTPAGMIQWDYPDPGRYKASFTGFAPPGATKYTFNSNIPGGSSPLPVPLVNDSQGTVVLCGRNDILYQNGKENGPCELTITDVYGNVHKVSVAFSGRTTEGRHYLRLTVK